MSAPRVYIAGPMTGYPLFNFPAFDAATEEWREAGWDVVNPAEEQRKRGEPVDLPWSHYLRHDIRHVSTCDAVAFLPGWRDSKGATLEHHIASSLGMDLFDALTFQPLDCGEKGTNPKDAIGSDKLPLHLWPELASALGSLALLEGMLKYGRSNFRAIGVRASIYHDALRRHIGAWFEGEDCAPDSGLPHLAHALACIAILVDAEAAGKLNDDRMFAGGHRAGTDALTPHVARLKALHAGKAPKHYTIADSTSSPT